MLLLRIVTLFVALTSRGSASYDMSDWRDLENYIAATEKGIADAALEWSTFFFTPLGNFVTLEIVIKQAWSLYEEKKPDLAKQVLEALEKLQAKINNIEELSNKIYQADVWIASKMGTYLLDLEDNWILMHEATKSNPNNTDSSNSCLQHAHAELCWLTKMNDAAEKIKKTSHGIRTAFSYAIHNFNIATKQNSLQRFGYSIIAEEMTPQWSNNTAVLHAMSQWRGWCESKVEILMTTVSWAKLWLDDQATKKGLESLRWFEADDILADANDDMAAMRKTHEDCTAWNLTVPFDDSKNEYRRRLYSSSYSHGRVENKCYKNVQTWHWWSFYRDHDTELQLVDCPSDRLDSTFYGLKYEKLSSETLPKWRIIQENGPSYKDKEDRTCSGTYYFSHDVKFHSCDYFPGGPSCASSSFKDKPAVKYTYEWSCKSEDAQRMKLRVKPIITDLDPCYFGKWTNVLVETDTPNFLESKGSGATTWKFVVIPYGKPGARSCGERKGCQCTDEYNITSENGFVQAFCSKWDHDTNWCYLSGGESAKSCPGARKSSKGDFYWTQDEGTCRKATDVIQGLPGILNLRG